MNWSIWIWGILDRYTPSPTNQKLVTRYQLVPAPFAGLGPARVVDLVTTAAKKDLQLIITITESV